MILFLRVAPGLSIALEERDRPELRSRPIAVSRPGGRGLICEVNGAAHHYGVSPGMTAAQARHHCPDVRILTLDSARVAAVGEEIYTVLGRFTPLVQPLEPGQVVCDLSGCERHWRDVWSLARSAGMAVREATGLSASIGIGSNRLVAELASTTADSGSITIVEAGQEQAFLADLPLTALPEVDPNLALTFAVLGLSQTGQFAALPAAAVKNRFGALGERLHRYSRGIDPRPVAPPDPKPTISARYECEDGTPEEALEGLHRLATHIGGELQQQGLQGRIVTLRVFWKASGSPLTPNPLSLQGRGDPGGMFVHGGSTATEVPRLRRTAPPCLDSVARPSVAEAVPQDRPEGHASSQSLRHLVSSCTRLSDCVGPFLEGDEEAALRSRLGHGGTELRRALPGGEAFPIPYRIHSYGLPQPNGNPSRPLPSLPVERENTFCTKQTHFSPLHPLVGRTNTMSAMVRTPIGTEGPLSQRAERLLLEQLTGWPGEGRPCLAAIELEVSEFAQPEQMGFAELNRIGETGGLEGMSPERRNALVHGDETWTARHGVTAFRHVAVVDPANVVTERRVRWATGLRSPAARNGCRRT